MIKNKMAIIGDVHGKIDKYINIAKKYEYSVQVGDMGFDYELLESLPSSHHKFVGGNHDNYDVYHKCNHALRDYGPYYNPIQHFYYIRGAYSIDMSYRVAYERQTGIKSWWKEEQLNFGQMYRAYNNYCLHDTKLIITHTCPKRVVDVITTPYILQKFGYSRDFNTPTQQLLDECFELKKPKLWVFGHFHKDVCVEIEGTTFICLAELSHMTIDTKGNWKFKQNKGNINDR